MREPGDEAPESLQTTARPEGPVESGTWLSGRCLVLAGSALDCDVAGASVASETGSIPLESLFLSTGSSSDGGDGDAPSTTGVVALFFPTWEPELGGDAVLALETSAGTLELPQPDLQALTTDPESFVRDALAPLDAPARARVLEFLPLTLERVPKSERYQLGQTLFSIREALRERLPPVVVSQADKQGLSFDRLMVLDDRSFVIEGWMVHEHIRIVRLTVVSPEGSRAEILDRLSRVARPDMTEYFFGSNTERAREKLGYICFFELDAISVHPEGWILEIEDERGDEFEAYGRMVETDILEIRQAILRDPDMKKLPDARLMTENVYPAVSRIQRRLGKQVAFESVVQHGTPPQSPEVSIVVPLYLHIQHLEIQLAQFANDPELFDVDLIYVLDSPEHTEALRTFAAELYGVYEIPFRVATLERNFGFAAACNAGASLATSRLLLLLNSDVLPGRPGWLSEMRAFYDATPNIGALGPKLLYEDDTIQHAGMYFVEYPDPGLATWVDATYFKGLHRSLPGANVTRRVPAVSGSCLMIDRLLYEELGGLQQIYVQGDYEDAHLCLELVERGLDNWYLSEVELYHLEGQSYTSDARGDANRYNMWLHTHLLGQRIKAVMAQEDFNLPGSSPNSRGGD